jgi:hypothetical protein
MPFVDKYGRVQQGTATRPMLSDRQRTWVGVLAALVLPSLALRSYRQFRSEKTMDLSRFSISAEPFSTPAIDKLDGTVRIEFCTS